MTNVDLVYSKYLSGDVNSTTASPNTRRVSNISQLEDVDLDDLGNTSELDDFYGSDEGEGGVGDEVVDTRKDLFESSSDEEGVEEAVTVARDDEGSVIDTKL